MDGGAWWAAVHGVAKSRTRLSDFTFTCHFHALEKEMATHSSVLAWRIPGTGEPGGLPSMGSYRVGHDWSDLAAAAAALFWGKRVIDEFALPFFTYLVCVSVCIFFFFYWMWDSLNSVILYSFQKFHTWFHNIPFSPYAFQLTTGNHIRYL